MILVTINTISKNISFKLKAISGDVETSFTRREGRGSECMKLFYRSLGFAAEAKGFSVMSSERKIRCPSNEHETHNEPGGGQGNCDFQGFW